MPGAELSNPPRRVRCPKCSAPLTEPPLGTPVYQCPFCSALLQAKRAAPTKSLVTDARKQEMMSGLGQVKRGGGTPEVEQTSTSSSEESSSFSPSNSSIGERRIKFLGGDYDDRVSPSTVSDDQPLSRNRNHRPTPIHFFVPRTDSEKSLYSPRSKSSLPPDRNGKTSHRDVQGIPEPAAGHNDVDAVPGLSHDKAKEPERHGNGSTEEQGKEAVSLSSGMAAEVNQVCESSVADLPGGKSEETTQSHQHFDVKLPTSDGLYSSHQSKLDEAAERKEGECQDEPGFESPGDVRIHNSEFSLKEAVVFESSSTARQDLRGGTLQSSAEYFYRETRPSDSDKSPNRMTQKFKSAPQSSRLRWHPREDRAPGTYITQHQVQTVERYDMIAARNNTKVRTIQREYNGELEKGRIPSSSADYNSAGRNEPEEGTTSGSDLYEEDAESETDIYEAPPHIKLSEHLSSLNDRSDMRRQFLETRELDSVDQQILRSHFQPTGIQKTAGGLDRKRSPQYHPHPGSFVQASCCPHPGDFESNLMSTSRQHRHARADAYRMSQGPYLAQNQGSVTAVSHVFSPAQHHLYSGTDPEAPGYGQRRYRDFGDTTVFYNQGLQMDGDRMDNNGTFNQSMQTHSKDSGLKQSIINSRGRFIDSQLSGQPASPYLEQQQRKMGLQNRQFSSERQVVEAPVSVMYDTQEHSLGHLSNGFQTHQGLVAHGLPLSCAHYAHHAFPVQALSPGATMPALMLEHPQHSMHPVCAFCIQQSHMQHHQLLHGTLQHHCAICSPQPMCMAAAQHQLWVPQNVQLTPQYHPQVGKHQPDLPIQQDKQQGSDAIQLESGDQLARKEKRHPPLPTEGTAPYVLCQHCNQLLQVPAHLPSRNGNIQKLRCGSCMKISKFSIYHLEQANTEHHSLPKSSRSSSNSSLKCLTAKDQSTLHLVHSVTTGSGAGSVPPSEYLPLPRSGVHSRLLPLTVAQEKVDIVSDQLSTELHVDSGSCSASQQQHGDYRLLETNDIAKATSATGSLDPLLQSRASAGIQGQAPGTVSSMPSVAQQQDIKKFVEPHISSTSTVAASSPMDYSTNTFVPTNRSSVEHPGLEGTGMDNNSSSKSNTQVQGAAESDLPGFPANDLRSDVCGVKEELPPPLAAAVPGSPLHAHFGYRSPAELLQRCASSKGAEFTVKTSGGTSEDIYLSRSTSGGSNGRLATRTLIPGSPLRDKLGHESSESSQTHGASSNGQSAPQLPAGPGLYEQVSSDSPYCDESLYLKEPTQSRNHGESVQDTGQDTGQGHRSLAGFLKRSLKELSNKGSQVSSRRRVRVNGHLLSNAAVKKAEERAGRLHPGSYWYDYQAGFWGVLGGPCDGIIPPFIEDLNYPMPRDCANGKTEILVNGRELHQKDLDALARRGFPTTPGKSYTIEINGRVVDAASGQQLRSLGKLAPTVERKGQGYGMFQSGPARN